MCHFCSKNLDCQTTVQRSGTAEISHCFGTLPWICHELGRASRLIDPLLRLGSQPFQRTSFWKIAFNYNCQFKNLFSLKSFGSSFFYSKNLGCHTTEQNPRTVDIFSLFWGRPWICQQGWSTVCRLETFSWNAFLWNYFSFKFVLKLNPKTGFPSSWTLFSSLSQTPG